MGESSQNGGHGGHRVNGCCRSWALQAPTATPPPMQRSPCSALPPIILLEYSAT